MADDSAPDLNGLKILVIDDSKTIRRTAETLLTKEGCTVFTAIDGFDALSKIADHHPDVIFVDIMMPKFRQCLDSLRCRFHPKLLHDLRDVGGAMLVQQNREHGRNFHNLCNRCWT